MTEPTNADLYGVLMGIKEDIGGLKVSSTLQLKGLENHGVRINLLEGHVQRQKGAVKVWGVVATALASIAAVAVELVRPHHG